MILKSNLDLFNFIKENKFFLIIFCLIISYNILKYYKNIKSRNKLMSAKREDVKKRLSELDSIINYNSEFRVECHNKYVISLVGMIVSVVMMYCVVLLGPSAIGLMFVFFFIFAISLIVYAYVVKEYKDRFKKDIVESVIANYDKDMEYYPNQGYTFDEYKLCKFKEHCDIFQSEDLIVNKNKDFYYAEIIVKVEHEDDNGSHEEIKYHGGLAKMYINNCNCNIYLGSNSFIRRDGFDVITFENEEFNKLFDCCSDNELYAYKILTPDVMEELVNLKNNVFGDIDIRILNNLLYVRFNTGDLFSPNLLNKRKEKENIIFSIIAIEEVMNTMDKVKNIINSKSIN